MRTDHFRDRRGFRSTLNILDIRASAAKSKSVYNFVNTSLLPLMESPPGTPTRCAENGLFVLYLPGRHTWAYWYRFYASNTPLLRERAQFGQFRNILRLHFPHLRQAPLTGHLLCKDCDRLRRRKQHAKTPAECRAIEREFAYHVRDQRRERDAYNRHKLLARNDPDHYLSLIADCRAKSEIPTFYERVKGRDSYDNKQHLVTLGIINHANMEASFYLSLDWWPDNENFICTALVEVIERYLRTTRRRPPTLFLQLDNCTASNKNRIFLAVMATLVAKGWFKHIELSYLLVGHTHEDIDRLFSNLWTILAERDILTIHDAKAGMEEFFARSNSEYDQVQVYIQNVCFSFSTWLHEVTYLAKLLDTAHGFKLSLDTEGDHTQVTVQARARNGLTDQSWGPKFLICSSFPTTTVPLQPPITKTFDPVIINKMLDTLADVFVSYPESRDHWLEVARDPVAVFDLNTPAYEVRSYSVRL